MHQFKIGVLGLLTVLATTTPALASKFANQFIEFEMPPAWQCNLEGAEWVCQSTDELKKRDAIIVLAAKLKGDQDSLDQYLTYLKGAKTYQSVQGKPVKSEVRYAKMESINGQPWVDSLHLESEIPGFYTRYLATIKQDIGVLVTYSINKTKYQQYLGDFDNMVKTLKVFRKAGGINAAPASGNIFAQTQIPAAVTQESVFPAVAPQGGAENQPTRKKGDDMTLYYILGAGVIGYILWRRRQTRG